MVQTCSKCSRVNPADAVYCYFDGFVLHGHSRNGGPVAVGAQAFAHAFVFPGGRQCRSFNELALACQEEWAGARDLLQQGYLEKFFGGLGRADLAQAAKEAAKFPDADRGLDQLLEKLPTDVLAEPRLSLETQEINLGTLEVGASRSFELHAENQGMRLLYGTISSDDAGWLTLGDATGNQKSFAFQHEKSLLIKVRPEKLRANNKPLEAHLEVESNGGSFLVVVRAAVPVKPFPSGTLAGAKSPRQAAEKAKANPKEAAVLFENGEVAEWYKTNGWTYPVQGPAASGLGAVQQFFEALGLTPPPKVEISTKRIELSGDPGEKLTGSFEVKSQEKKPIYAHATSNEPWLEVSRAKLNGRVAVINLSVPAVPNRQGETLTAKLMVQSNGNQRFVVPVTLQIGGSLVFGDPTPAPVATAAMAELPAAPLVVTPTVRSRGSGSYRRPSKGKPAWVHLVPALLLFLAVLGAVIVDRLMPSPVVAVNNNDDDIRAEDKPGTYDPWKYELKDPDPRLAVRFDDATMRFGVEMTKEKDPRNPDKFKRLTYEDHGKSNNTIIKIDGYEYKFGFETPNNVWGGRRRELKKKEIPGRRGWTSTMEFTSEKVEAVQHVEIVPGQSGYLDTLLVRYTIRNKDEGKHKVGIRVMLDTFIGANDGVPFTVPGRKGFVDTKQDFGAKEIPDYIEVIEKPDDPKDPGTVARMGLAHIKLPSVNLEDLERLRICRFPGHTSGWDWEPLPMKTDNVEEQPDSCVALYWPYETMNPKDVRQVAFTYGLSTLEIGAGAAGGASLALSVPASVQPNSDFVVTAYVWNAAKGDAVKLQLPAGLILAPGESEEKMTEGGGARSQVFWHVRSDRTGAYTLEATSGNAKSKPKQVIVRATSIFG